jgi:hypothetical protein
MFFLHDLLPSRLKIKHFQHNLSARLPLKLVSKNCCQTNFLLQCFKWFVARLKGGEICVFRPWQKLDSENKNKSRNTSDSTRGWVSRPTQKQSGRFSQETDTVPSKAFFSQCISFRPRASWAVTKIADKSTRCEFRRFGSEVTRPKECFLCLAHP